MGNKYTSVESSEILAPFIYNHDNKLPVKSHAYEEVQFINAMPCHNYFNLVNNIGN